MALTKVQNTGISDDAVTTDKIENSTVLAADIAPGTLTNAKLSNSAVTINGSSVSLGGSATLKHIEWQALTVADGSTTLTAEAGKGYFLDTNTGVIEVFLPSSPTRGDTIVLVDYGGTFGTNQCIINTGGQLIDSTTGPDFKVTTNNAVVELVYVDSNKGYLVKLLQAAGTTPSGVMNAGGGYDTTTHITATGGTVTTSGDFKIHTFTGDGDFIVSFAGLGTSTQPSIVDYMVVAGGGGGGDSYGGGGGAGGFRESLASCSPTHTPSGHTASPLKATSGITVTAQTYPISVGAGGGSNPGGSPNAGSDGSNSVFSTITSTGGGGGKGNPSPGTPGNGGSGGGGAAFSPVPYGTGPGSRNPGGSGNTPPVSPAQGSNGGYGLKAPNGVSAGGGGGATAAGCGASGPGGGHYSQGGNGGAGATTHITGSPVAYAGGGGGATEAVSGGRGQGGTGGGADGRYSPGPGGITASSGPANLGGGGGGGFCGSIGSGGKGVVIIRYKFQ